MVDRKVMFGGLLVLAVGVMVVMLVGGQDLRGQALYADMDGPSLGGGTASLPCAPRDDDFDRYDTCEEFADCDDTTPFISPAIPENCFDTVDQNCDGSRDCSCVDYDGSAVHPETVASSLEFIPGETRFGDQPTEQRFDSGCEIIAREGAGGVPSRNCVVPGGPHCACSWNSSGPDGPGWYYRGGLKCYGEITEQVCTSNGPRTQVYNERDTGPDGKPGATCGTCNEDLTACLKWAS